MWTGKIWRGSDLYTILKKLLLPFTLPEKIREAERCTKCAKRLRERYTYTRVSRILSGDVNLNIHVRKCPDHNETNRNAMDAFINSSDFDPRVIMESGGISNLSREFLIRFYVIHRRHLKDLDPKNYVLNLGGTGESGDEIVFMAKDGLLGITLDSTVMPSENSKYKIPFLQNMKGVFGDPMAAMRDMGTAIKESVFEVFPRTLQLICHYHFVRALVKDVFSSYADLRGSKMSTRALAAISGITLP